MGIDLHDTHTETFSNARGWTAVRVTHGPTNTVAERERSESLRSAVQAQQECLDEIRERLSGDGPPPAPAASDEVVTRAEFDALAARLARLEAHLGLPEPQGVTGVPE